MTEIDKLYYEKTFISQGKKYIAGIDEVGRGPLAGPVVCAIVIMPLDDIIDGIDDSKKLSQKKRENLDKIIREKAISYKICEIDESRIDEINILNATKECMLRCIEEIEVKPDIVLVDAVKLDTSVPTYPIIKGDLLSYSIGCASIIAKVYRDNLMVEYGKLYPEYDFKGNKGYGTKKHTTAIKEIGPCKIHRRSFIKNFWEIGESEKPQSI